MAATKSSSAKSSATASPVKQPAKTAKKPPVVKAAPKPAPKTAPKATPKPASKAAPKAAKARGKAANGVPPEQRRHYVEMAAYYIAERRGFAPGDPLADWVRAEAEIDRLLADGRLGN